MYGVGLAGGEMGEDSVDEVGGAMRQVFAEHGIRGAGIEGAGIDPPARAEEAA